jgi:hypothetical protein
MFRAAFILSARSRLGWSELSVCHLLLQDGVEASGTAAIAAAWTVADATPYFCKE